MMVVVMVVAVVMVAICEIDGDRDYKLASESVEWSSSGSMLYMVHRFQDTRVIAFEALDLHEWKVGLEGSLKQWQVLRFGRVGSRVVVEHERERAVGFGTDMKLASIAHLPTQQHPQHDSIVSSTIVEQDMMTRS